MSSNRSIALIGAGIVALVVLVIAVVLLADGQDPTDYPPDSPEGVVQGYLAAWESGDYAAAYAFFSSRVQAGLSEADYQAAAEQYAAYGGPTNGPARRIFIDDVTEGGTRVAVRLTVEELVGDGLSTTVYRSTRSIALAC
jgi:hypothetical protein